MNVYKLSNVNVTMLRKFLISEGLKKIKNTKGRGGHEKWVRKDLLRPVVFQSHITPVPEFILKQILRQLNITRKEFIEKIKKL